MSVRKSSSLAALVSAATIAATVAISVPAAQADAGTPAYGKLIGTFTPQTLAPQSTTRATSSPLKGSAENCTPLPANSAARAAGATTACIQVTDSSGSSLQADNGRLSAVQPDALVCGINADSYYYDRHSYCLNNGKITYTEKNKQTGEIVGEAVLLVSGSASLSASSGQWQESLTVTLDSATGLVTELNVGLTASCGAPCTATSPSPWPGIVSLVKSQSASGSVAFQTTPGAGNVSNVTTSYDINVTQPGAIPVIEDTTWSNPRQIRCDTTFADDTSTGCVIPSIRPKLNLSLATYGAAAATYGWTEQRFIDHWGAHDSPLKRLAGDDAQKANRKRTCGADASRPFGYRYDIVPDDSCDEYPFAATYQGGTNGGLCADVIPQLEKDGLWYFYEDVNAPAITFNEPCVRGHVPNSQNVAAGLALGRNSQAERVIDAEQFDLIVA